MSREGSASAREGRFQTGVGTGQCRNVRTVCVGEGGEGNKVPRYGMIPKNKLAVLEDEIRHRCTERVSSMVGDVPITGDYADDVLDPEADEDEVMVESSPNLPIGDEVLVWAGGSEAEVVDLGSRKQTLKSVAKPVLCSDTGALGEGVAEEKDSRDVRPTVSLESVITPKTIGICLEQISTRLMLDAHAEVRE